MISLIIAVYNTPIKDLQRCFESIQHQTYRDFEVIVVDDGSKDEVASFMDRFSAEDPRFHVYHIENGGVSRARNIGLSHACGEYISFCDADDELTEVFFQHALSYVKIYHLDMISGGVLVRHKQHDEICACQKPANDIWIYTDMIPVLDFALTAYSKQGHPEFDTALIARVYPKLYKAELAKSVSFPEDIRMSEDNLYSFAVFSKCKRFGLVDETWYIYYQNEYSLTHRNDGILEHRQKEQYDFARKVAQKKETAPASLQNAYQIRLFHIFMNYLSVMLISMRDIMHLLGMRNSAWGKNIQQVSFDGYCHVRKEDYRFQRIMKNHALFVAYVSYRALRFRLGRIRSYIKSNQNKRK